MSGNPHLIEALKLVRDLRYRAIQLRIDPRAVRIALKYALLCDTACMRLSAEEDKKLDAIAMKLLKETPQMRLAMAGRTI